MQPSAENRTQQAQRFFLRLSDAVRTDWILGAIFLLVTALYAALMISDRVPTLGLLGLGALWLAYALLGGRLSFATPLDLPILVLLVLLIGPLSSITTAQGVMLPDLPPGIARQAQPLLAAMMQHMQEMGMMPEQMEMMMADMQMMVDRLPPGIFLQVLQLMPQLEMEEMMLVHQLIREGGLLEAPPGQIVVLIRSLLR